MTSILPNHADMSIVPYWGLAVAFAVLAATSAILASIEWRDIRAGLPRARSVFCCSVLLVLLFIVAAVGMLRTSLSDY